MRPLLEKQLSTFGSETPKEVKSLQYEINLKQNVGSEKTLRVNDLDTLTDRILQIDFYFPSPTLNFTIP